MDQINYHVLDHVNTAFNIVTKMHNCHNRSIILWVCQRKIYVVTQSNLTLRLCIKFLYSCIDLLSYFTPSVRTWSSINHVPTVTPWLLHRSNKSLTFKLDQPSIKLYFNRTTFNQHCKKDNTLIESTYRPLQHQRLSHNQVKWRPLQCASLATLELDEIPLE